VTPRFQLDDVHHFTSPQATVPNSYVWDLVEYLAIQRVMVTYTYSDDGFVVTFLHMDRDAAQKLLDEWATSYFREQDCDQRLESAGRSSVALYS
jgi:hypothetical protein